MYLLLSKYLSHHDNFVDQKQNYQINLYRADYPAAAYVNMYFGNIWKFLQKYVGNNQHVADFGVFPP